MIEEGGKALAAYLKPREQGRIEGRVRRIRRRRENARPGRGILAADPQRTFELQFGLGKSYLDLWATSVKRMAGEDDAAGRRARPARQALYRSGMVEEPVLRFPQAGLSPDRELGDHLVKDADGLDPLTRQKAEFYVRQIVNAIAPSNFVLTNPELLRETLALERREPCARHAHAGGGHRGRRRRAEHPADRPLPFRGRAQSRDHARQGDLRERPDAAHPVRADDREGAQSARC